MLVHNKPPHSFSYLSRTTWVSDTITQDISSKMAGGYISRSSLPYFKSLKSQKDRKGSQVSSK